MQSLADRIRAGWNYIGSLLVIGSGMVEYGMWSYGGGAMTS